MTEPFKINIEKATLENNNYRKVIFTGEKIQLVLMNLKGGEDIPLEVHHGIDQFIRVESGKARVKIEKKDFELGEDEIVIIPAGKKHYVCNASKSKDLKIYSIYSPPEHPKKTVHKTKKDSDESPH